MEITLNPKKKHFLPVFQKVIQSSLFVESYMSLYYIQTLYVKSLNTIFT